MLLGQTGELKGVGGLVGHDRLAECPTGISNPAAEMVGTALETMPEGNATPVQRTWVKKETPCAYTEKSASKATTTTPAPHNTLDRMGQAIGRRESRWQLARGERGQAVSPNETVNQAPAQCDRRKPCPNTPVSGWAGRAYSKASSYTATHLFNIRGVEEMRSPDGYRSKGMLCSLQKHLWGLCDFTELHTVSHPWGESESFTSIQIEGWVEIASLDL
ncbi:hypothetical protein EQH57_0436 [Dictyocoela roeselum]|nr:hypothetical protein EQH57_0436 [Dictyocoela roeselum]